MTEPSAGLEQEETEHDVDLIHECVVKMAKEISDFMDRRCGQNLGPTKS